MMSVDAVSGPNKSEEAVSGLMNRIVDQLKFHEHDIQSSFESELSSNGVIFGVPDHIKTRFDQWEAQLQSPEQQQMLMELKAKMKEAAHFNGEYVQEAAAMKAERIQLELAMKAAGKTMSGIQTLLSSQ